MIMKPCYWCPRGDDCDLREEMRKPCLALGLTVMRFRCERYYSMFTPGMVVQAALPYVWDGSYAHGEGPNQVAHTMDAVVMKSYIRDGKLLVWAPADGDFCLIGDHPGDHIVYAVRVSTKLLTPTDRRREICAECGKPVGEIDNDWGCDSCAAAGKIDAKESPLS